MPPRKLIICCPGVWDSFFLCETICVAWFCLELVARFTTSPGKSKFVKDYLNIVDLMAVLPFFLQLLAGGTTEAEAEAVSDKAAKDQSVTVLFLVFR